MVLHLFLFQADVSYTYCQFEHLRRQNKESTEKDIHTGLLDRICSSRSGSVARSDVKSIKVHSRRAASPVGFELQSHSCQEKLRYSAHRTVASLLSNHRWYHHAVSFMPNYFIICLESRHSFTLLLFIPFHSPTITDPGFPLNRNWH